MKKIGLFFALIMCLSFVSPAILFEELNKDLQAGETFVGSVELPLVKGFEKEDIKVFEDRREVNFERGIFKQGNLTLVYVVFPKSGNFSIDVSNFLYSSKGTLTQDSINHPVEIKSVGNKVLSILPGIVFGSNLSLVLVNLGSEKIEVDIQGNKSELETNVSKRVKIRPEKDFFYLTVKSYRSFSIPVIYFNSSVNSSVNVTNSSQNNPTEMKVLPREVEGNLTINTSFKFSISVENLLNETNFLEVSSSLEKLNFSRVIELEPLEKRDFSFDFFPSNMGIFLGDIIFKSGDYLENVLVKFYVLENEEDFEEFFQESVDSNSTCVDVGGEVCMENWECVGGLPRLVMGQFCCVGGKCVSQAELYPTPKKNYLVGILSVVVVGVLGYFVYKKFKDVKAKPKF